MSLVYDTGALVAAERRVRRLWEIHAAAVRGGVRPVVPVVVLAQAWRGGPQANLSRLLRGCRILPDTEHLGRAAGAACARSGTSDVVDAMVVGVALSIGAAVLTSDPDDLRALGVAFGHPLTVLTI